MQIVKTLKTIRTILFGNKDIFIGDIPHSSKPFEEKPNMWGGINYRYRVPFGLYVRALDISGDKPRIVWDRVTFLSKHSGIPAYRVTVDNDYSVICSPIDTIVVKKGDRYRKVDLSMVNIVGMSVPCYENGSCVPVNRAVTRVEQLGEVMDMWDISMKNNTIFLADNTLFVYDTVAVHVPVTKGAIKDVFSMYPRNNLIAEQTGELVPEPEHSAIVGLYNLAKTPAGRKKINDILPDRYDITKPLSKSELIELLKKIAIDKGPDAGRVINEIRKLGDNVAFEQGVTIGLSDLAPLTSEKRELMPEIMREIRKIPKQELTQEKLGDIYTKYIDKSNRIIEDHFKKSDSHLADIYLSKSRGSASQYRDMLFSPIAVSSDALPTKPILHSYIEGLTPAEYGIAAHGARLGVLGRSQGTAKPGALGKELMATANTLVVNKAKGESMGEIAAPLSKWKSRDVVDRFLSRDVISPNGVVLAKKEDLVTAPLLHDFKEHNVEEIWVYSPLQSSSADGGIPGMAYGTNHKGQIPTPGENIGANSAFSIVEPLFSGAMGSFHHGGALGGKAPAYPRIKQIVELTKSLPDKAPLAKEDGTVRSIVKDSLGGHTVTVGDSDYYVTSNNKPLVNIGSKVKKGEPLSSGVIDPRDIADLRSLAAAQEYMVDELHMNVPRAKRKAIETVVEGLTRHAQVTDPGDSNYLPGDIDLIANIERTNKELINKIKYDFLFKGANMLPGSTQSWISKFNFGRIKAGLNKDLMEGAEADISGYEPAPAMAYGKDFGKGDHGKY